MAVELVNWVEIPVHNFAIFEDTEGNLPALQGNS
jgi:hypothetical protein